MNRIQAIALLAIANFAMAGNSFAQDHQVQVNVPFDFTVSAKLLPAGTYTIKRDAENIILISNREKPISALALVGSGGKSSPGWGKVTFHRYGDQYFLSEILCDSAGMSLSLPTSKQEHKVQVLQARVNPRGETFIAAR